MACQDFQENLSAWLDGELTGTDRAQMTAHLETCSDCRNLLQRFEYTSSSVRQIRNPPAPRYVTDAAMRLVREMPQQSNEPWLSRALRSLVAAAAFPRITVPAIGLAATALLAVLVSHFNLLEGTADRRTVASSKPTVATDRTHLAKGTNSPSLSPAAAPSDDSYRLASVPDNSPDKQYDFRDPNTHGRRAAVGFSEQERLAWRQGAWRHERHFGREGWWWVVGRVWYWYEQSEEGPPSYVSDTRIVDPLAANDTGTTRVSEPKD